MHAGFSLLTLLPGVVGGTETYVEGLLGAFGDGDGPEQVTVLAAEGVRRSYARKARGPVSLVKVPHWHYSEKTALRVLAVGAGLSAGRLLARRASAGLDVVHYPLTVSLPASTVSTVLTYHDAQHLDHPAFFSLAERAYRAITYDRAARAATIVMTPSNFTRRAAIEHLGLEPERVLVSSHGIDHSRFVPDDDGEDPLDELNLPERYVIYPANLWAHKNHERLVQAMGLVADRDLVLVLTGGDQGQLGSLLATAERARVASRLRYLGYVEHRLLPALYRRAEAMIFPSLYEGFGAPPLEAMACACPTAVARAGALPESCGPATLYFDPTSPESIAAAIDRVVSDGQLRAQLREAGIRHASRFTWSSSARRHEVAYGNAIAVGESSDGP